MATVNGYTAEKMQEIADKAFKSAAIVGDNLVITHQDDTTTNVGNVRGPEGDPGVSDMNLYDPPGVAKPLLIPAVPANHGLCDGTTEYDAALAPILVAVWGSGPSCVNGVSAVGKFRFPDLRGKTFFGLHPGIAAFDTLGETGGTKDAVAVSHDHTASSDQPAHSHTADQAAHDHGGTTTTNGSHSHGVGGDSWDADRIVFTSPSSITMGSGGQEVTYTHIDPAGDHYHVIPASDPGISVSTADPAISTTVNANGVSGTDMNLPPYRVVNWIMRLV